MSLIELLNQKQIKILAIAVAVVAAVNGIFAFDGDAKLSASLISSVPPAEAQVFNVQKAKATISARQAAPRKPLPKKEPTYTVIGTRSVSVTAYNSMASQTDGSPNYTADGTRTAWQIIACPYDLAFGTKIRFQNSFKGTIFYCHDRSATPRGHVDIWMEKYIDAINYGRRNDVIEILA